MNIRKLKDLYLYLDYRVVNVTDVQRCNHDYRDCEELRLRRSWAVTL